MNDVTEEFYRDIRGGIPSYVVREYAQGHLTALRNLSKMTPDVEQAIADVEKFLADTAEK